MKAQHTPGPFEINGDGPLIAVITASARVHAEITAPSRSRFDPVTGETVEANAHLLKAAPQLLEALEMVRDADDDCRRDGMPTIPVQPRAVIDAAIAAAKGGAQ